jgi:hypothetical protein
VELVWGHEMHDELLTTESIHLAGSTFHTPGSRVILSMMIARRVVLELGAAMMLVNGREQHPVHPCLKVIIQQATTLLTFLVQTREQKIE